MEKDYREKMIVSSVARAPLDEMYPPDGKLPSLIADARENPLTRIATHEGDVLVKAPAFPYVEHHMLVIPDRIDQAPTPSVTRVPDQLLTKTFGVAGETARYYAENSDIKEVSIGWNHSPHEDKKHVATQVNTLHFHVIGYTDQDLHQTVSADEIQKRPELRTKEREPLAGLITTILDHEVFGKVAQKPEFRDLFNKRDDGDRITFDLPQGIDTLSHSSTQDLMKEIHTRTEKAYDSVASCFFLRDVNDPASFAQTEDGRYALLSQDERLKRVEEYSAARPYLDEKSKKMLSVLAHESKTVNTINELKENTSTSPLTDDEKYGRNPLMALKGLAYAAVFTGTRQPDESFSWRFGIDPVVFAPRDVLQASRGTFAHFERPKDKVMSTEKLEAMKKDEQQLVAHLNSR